MAQKMVKRESGEFKAGLSGLAMLVKLSPNMARVDFIESSDSVNLNLVLDGDDKNIPDYFQFGKMKDNAKIQVKITLGEKNDDIGFISPANAEQTAKLLWFSGGEKEAPTPKAPKKPLNDWGKPNPNTCGATIEITKGAWKGCRLYVHLNYEFAKDEETGATVIYASKRGEKLAEFLDAVGVSTENMPYTENLLPAIQKDAQQLALEFQVFIEKGWVNRFYSQVQEDAFGAMEETPVVATPAQPEPELNVDEIHPALQ